MDTKRTVLKQFSVSIVVMFCILCFMPLLEVSAINEIQWVSPKEGQRVQHDMTVEIKMATKPATVTMYIDGAIFKDLGYSSFDGFMYHFSGTVNTWALADGPHIVSVVSKDGAITYVNGTTFFVDNYPPVISGINVIYSPGEKAAKKGDRIVITANVTDVVSGVSTVTADVTKLMTDSDVQSMFDDGQHNDTVQYDGTFGTKAFVTNALTTGYSLIQVTAYDKMGNKGSKFAFVIMDNHPPDIKDSVVVYPTGQKAAKIGDEVRIVTQVEDKGSGGMLRLGTDITLVLDNSGSMMRGENPSMDSLKDAVNNFVDMTHSEDRIAIYAFGTNPQIGDIPELWESAEQYLPFTTMDDYGKQAVRDLLASDSSDFSFAHNTPIWDTIGEAINYSVRTSLESNRQGVVVAITDGTDYGYDWYDIPDPSWWPVAQSQGYYGIGFERGSEQYCPWNDYGHPEQYTTHWGEYPAPWAADPEVHYLNAPIFDDNSFDYNPPSGPLDDWDYSNGVRNGLLHAPVPVFTVGLGLPHHTPITANTTEYDLYRIATTSNNDSIHGKYYYAPMAGDLANIYNDISFFINLAGDINITPPGGVKTLTMDGANLGVVIEKPLYDDGSHDDVYKDDEMFGTNLFDVNTRVTDIISVQLNATDIANNKGQHTVPVLVDNILPQIEGLVAHVVDGNNYEPVNRSFAKDGDGVYFTVNASDWGKVHGLIMVLLNGTVLGGDKQIPMTDNGSGINDSANDGIFTSGVFIIQSGDLNGIVNIEATAYDIAMNKASVSGSLWLLNGPDVMGQIIHPLNGTIVKGMVEVRLIVNDDTNLNGADLIIAPDKGGPSSQRTMLMMAHGSEAETFTIMWNTSSFPDGIYHLDGEMSHKGGFKILSPWITVIIDNTPPVVDIQSPKDGAIITDKTDLLALIYDPPRSYVGGENLTSVTYVIDSNNSMPMGLLGGFDTDGPHYVFKINPWALKDGKHTFVITVVDRVGLTVTDNVTFFTDTQPPKLEPTNVPIPKVNTSGTFLFSFKVEDANGIAGGEITFDNGTKDVASFPFYRNGTSGLWEWSLDTTRLKNGNHTYCAVFHDRAGYSAVYCSRFIVSNTVPPPKPHVTHVVETPWWLIVVLIIVISCLVFTSGILVREWYLKRTGRIEDEEEIVEKATRRARAKEEEEEVPVQEGPRMEDLDEGPPLPEDEPIELPPPIKPLKKAPPIRSRRPTRPDNMEVSHIAPVAVSEPVKAVLEDAPKKAPKKVIKCPMCMFKIPVETDQRPLVLTCPKCGAKGKLK
jgi:Mg-chelatase subunit ChlD